MGGEPFSLGQRDHMRGQTLEPGLVDTHDVHALEEVAHSQRAREAGRAVGGENVVGPRGVVAQRSGCPRPAEDGSGIADHPYESLGVGDHQLQVLGGDGVEHLEGLLGARAQHAVPGAAHRRLDLGPPVGAGGEPCDLSLHRIGGGGVPRHQPRQPVGAVLGLQDQVGRGERGVGAGVGHHHHLRGAREGGRHPHYTGDLPLSQRDVGVARSGDHVHRGNRLGSVGQRGDGLRPAHGMDLGNPRGGGRSQGHVGDEAVGAGGHAHRDLVHARHPGRDGGHYQR